MASPATPEVVRYTMSKFRRAAIVHAAERDRDLALERRQVTAKKLAQRSGAPSTRAAS